MFDKPDYILNYINTANGDLPPIIGPLVMLHIWR